MSVAFYEVIAFPCGVRLSMPLGVFGWDPGYFRVYSGTRMHRHYRGGPLMLLYPANPLLFLDSIEHRLEDVVEWVSGCPVPEPGLGAWYTCMGTLVTVEPGAAWFSCTNPRRVSGSGPVSYSRAYGCIVELLVLYTKAAAGLEVPGGRGYLEGLRWCVARSSRGDERLVAVAERLVQAILGVLQGYETS